MWDKKATSLIYLKLRALNLGYGNTPQIAYKVVICPRAKSTEYQVFIKILLNSHSLFLYRKGIMVPEEIYFITIFPYSATFK